MPAKKHQITDEERAKNIRKLAREIGASDNPAILDGALRKIARPSGPPKPSASGFEKRAPTKEELATLSEQQLYDLFGTRYPVTAKK
jgi:hypothetical protein